MPKPGQPDDPLDPNCPSERLGQYRFIMADDGKDIVMDDTVEQTIFVMSLAQVEALLQWYTKKTNRIIV